MPDPSFFDPLRLPQDLLVALDNRSFHFAFQRWHFLARALHVISAGWFFGGIVLIDLRLLRRRFARALDVDALLDWALPSIVASLVVALATGALLFLHDPVHVGSHAYFTPKLLLITLAALNAALYHRFAGRRGPLPAGPEDASRPTSAVGMARLSGLVSLTLWVSVMLAASLNAEGIPKVFLR